MTPFSGKKQEKNNSASIRISVDLKMDIFFNEVEITKGIVWKKHIQKENFKKGLINLIETNRQITRLTWLPIILFRAITCLKPI